MNSYMHPHMEPDKVVWEQDRTHHKLMNGCAASFPGTWWSYEAVWWTCLEKSSERVPMCICVQHVYAPKCRVFVGYLLEFRRGRDVSM